MPPTVMMLLLLTLVSQCRAAPQWRNWSPQAILYLKGAHGLRLVLQRSSRDEDLPSHLRGPEHPEDDVRQPPSSPLRAAADGGRGHYPNQRALADNHF